MCSKFNVRKHMHIALCLLLLSCSSVFAEMVVIVNPDNPIDTLTKIEVKKLFLGKTKGFPDGRKAKPLEISEGVLRDEFREKILLRDEGSLMSYWSRMIFSGKGNPPTQFNNEEKLKQVVASNINAIGYIDRAAVDGSVKIISLR